MQCICCCYLVGLLAYKNNWKLFDFRKNSQPNKKKRFLDLYWSMPWCLGTLRVDDRTSRRSRVSFVFFFSFCLFYFSLSCANIFRVKTSSLFSPLVHFPFSFEHKLHNIFPWVRSMNLTDNDSIKQPKYPQN